MKNIYINAGYYNTKVLFDNKHKIFESKTQINEDAKNYIRIDNAKLEVGIGKRDINIKDRNLINECLTIYSILDCCDKIDAANVLLALPINQYLNQEVKKRYKEKLNRTLMYEINGFKKTVYIERCEIFMEGAAAMLNHNTKGVVGLIDIGGNTINCMIFIDGKLIVDTLIQLDFSMLALEEKIINTVNIKKGSNYQDYEFNSLLSSNDLEIKCIIDAIIYDFIEQITYKLKLKKWNIENMSLFFTGGGSITLEPYLKDVFPLAQFSNNPLYDNVDGLEKVGRVIFK